MENIGLYLGVSAIVLAFLSYFVPQVIKFGKMSQDDKRKLLLTYLAGLVTMAEDKIGAGHGAEKLAEVEAYFKTHAGLFYKMILRVFGKENLKGLIEEALQLVKKNFEK